jgi:hypothetical protein
MASLDGARNADQAKHKLRISEIASLLGWLVLSLVIGWSYVGHSSSPYGVCYAPSGRSVPCAALPRR